MQLTELAKLFDAVFPHALEACDNCIDDPIDEAYQRTAEAISAILQTTRTKILQHLCSHGRTLEKIREYYG